MSSSHSDHKEHHDDCVATPNESEDPHPGDYVKVGSEEIVLEDLVRRVHDDGSGAVSTFSGSSRFPPSSNTHTHTHTHTRHPRFDSSV